MPGDGVHLGDAPEILDDAVLARLVQEALADAGTLGLILSGSRGAGCARPDSDYDVYWVLRDDALAARQTRGEPERDKRTFAGQSPAELFYTCPQRLLAIAANPGWYTPGFATARVVLDKTGEVAAALQAIVALPPERAQADVAAGYDAYLNSFYRSLKAWRRDDMLGGRLHAAESALYLLRSLFPLERRWTPYHDRLQTQWEALAGQGWQDDELPTALLALLDSGEPHAQIVLETRVEALLEARGFGHVLDGWNGEIEQAKSWFKDQP